MSAYHVETIVKWDFPEAVPIDLKASNLRSAQVSLSRLTLRRFRGECEGSAHFIATKRSKHLCRRCWIPFGRMEDREFIRDSQTSNSGKTKPVDEVTVFFKFDLKSGRGFTNRALDIFEELLRQLRVSTPIQDLCPPDIYRRTMVVVGNDYSTGDVYWTLGEYLFNRRTWQLG